jgi:3-deoxy-manno-octulosonate cytidylyltransferase (CMP-KDO synthetase)
MDSKRKKLGIIPARFESSRFPGKPLAQIEGKPMIQWVYEACMGVFDHLVVATDDERILTAAEGFGANVLLTSSDHSSGTERCLEALCILEKKNLAFDMVVNIQGDEPLIKKEQLSQLLTCMEEDDADIATLVKVFEEHEDPGDPNSVKVVINTKNEALYFSRSPIPFHRDSKSVLSEKYLKHIGLYAYKSTVLKKICDLPVSKLEKAESLEQLRWLENGFTIRTMSTEYENIGIDTPDDLKKLKNYLSA